ncbi:MAG: hypothetical protein N2115_05790 [bacterium]|nr:hypothetical protein [bacterium]
MRKMPAVLLILFFGFMVQAQQQSDVFQSQLNLEEFEIIHLSSGVAGETNIKTPPQSQPVKQQDLSREEREQSIRRLQEIRTAMRKIEDDTSQQNPELKAIMDRINELQKKRKALIDEILADNFEYQQLKQKIASGDFQASDTMRLATFERQAAQDQRIRDIDQQIRELYQQRQTLLQKVLQDNQEYQSQIAESQTIMQNFRTSFQRPDTGSIGQFSTPPAMFQPPSSTDTGPRWRRSDNSGSESTTTRPSSDAPGRRSGGRDR